MKFIRYDRDFYSLCSFFFVFYLKLFLWSYLAFIIFRSGHDMIWYSIWNFIHYFNLWLIKNIILLSYQINLVWLDIYKFNGVLQHDKLTILICLTSTNIYSYNKELWFRLLKYHSNYIILTSYTCENIY